MSHKIIILVLATLTIENGQLYEGSIQAIKKTILSNGPHLGMGMGISLDRILVRSAILNCECCKYKNDYFVAHL